MRAMATTDVAGECEVPVGSAESIYVTPCFNWRRDADVLQHLSRLSKQDIDRVRMRAGLWTTTSIRLGPVAVDRGPERKVLKVDMASALLK